MLGNLSPSAHPRPPPPPAHTSQVPKALGPEEGRQGRARASQLPEAMGAQAACGHNRIFAAATFLEVQGVVCEMRPRPPADHSAQARVVAAAWTPVPGSSSLPRLGRLFLASRGVWGGAGASLSPGFNGAVLPSTPAVSYGALFPAAPIALGQDLSQALVCKGGLSPPHWTDGMFQCSPTWLCVEIR